MSEGLRRQIRTLADRFKDEALSAQLGISPSTLTRIISGEGKRISSKVLQRIYDNWPAGAIAPVRTPAPVEDPELGPDVVGQAMLAERRGDYRRATAMLAGLDEKSDDAVTAIAANLVGARAAAGQGDLEHADRLLASAADRLQRIGTMPLLYARVEFEWAMMLGRRQKTGDAIAAFQRAESALSNLGPPATPYVLLVREAFLSYVLLVGYYEDAERLLTLAIAATQAIERNTNGLWQVETALLAAVRRAAVKRQ